MFLLFTPYTYLYTSIYLILLFYLVSITNFYVFWLVIELIALILIGIAYTLFTRRVSSLIVYFLVQSISSFLIFVSYTYDNLLLLTLSIFLKLGIFPFHSWFFYSVYHFPNFMLYFVATIHKIPIIILLQTFSVELSHHVLWGSIIFTTLIAGLTMLNVGDLRGLITISSIGNNSWFLLRSQLSFYYFMLFFTVYSLFLFIVLLSSYGIAKIFSLTPFFTLSLITLRGLPPFPLFFVKIGVIYSLLLSISNTFYLVIFFLSASFMMVSYLRFLITRLVYQYSSPSVLFIY